MSNSIPTFSSPSINISENLKNANENEIDNQNKQQIKEKKKNESFDKNEDNNSIININNNVNNNNNNVKSRSLSASFDLKKTTRKTQHLKMMTSLPLGNILVTRTYVRALILVGLGKHRTHQARTLLQHPPYSQWDDIPSRI